MVIGNLPFTDTTEKLTIKKIIEAEINFPKQPKLTPEIKDLIKGMLNKNHEKRFNMNEIKKHPWTEGKQFRKSE